MPQQNNQKSDEPDYEKIAERHEKYVEFVASIIDKGNDDQKYTFVDAAKELIKYPVACCMLSLIFRESNQLDAVSSLITALVREEVLQNAPPMPLVSEQRRLH